MGVGVALKNLLYKIFLKRSVGISVDMFDHFWSNSNAYAMESLFSNIKNNKHDIYKALIFDF
jgi:hypothetical protein